MEWHSLDEMMMMKEKTEVKMRNDCINTYSKDLFIPQFSRAFARRNVSHGDRESVIELDVFSSRYNLGLCSSERVRC